ncbi:imidazole glycerol phosphate synthase subunit HisH [Mobilitalea sibirica]|uniref:Imidazole glycerol phosphate synthase subunit HisH n=1 Tax=Mobilitalea sibirica TaxID=1462919 RepID=A0A8J7H0P3_9FIRM|nr:imidazole glycerol phosphate synthase subunit HisH [Mobilitalea sibirica]MBH1942054.1 imidazole glycerol phosphate synthase subunit HisH [Mobilitalea sibirica]
MIVVLDYGMGNVGSILNMLKKIGVSAKSALDTDMIDQADKLILPGVGAFDKGMELLISKGFDEAIKRNVLEKGKPILGICLGMQMLGRKSEEGEKPGLDLIPFDNVKFHFNSSNCLKIPHMGWNYVDICNSNSPLLRGIETKQRYYFVHTYHAECDKRENVLMESYYGYPFTAAVHDRNIYGTQFHPEKSHNFGMKLLLNFAKEC